VLLGAGGEVRWRGHREAQVWTPQAERLAAIVAISARVDW